MKKRWFGRSLIFLAVICMALPVNMSFAAAEVEELHFLIPGGAGGGWDGTARVVGKALLDSGLVKQASFENMSGFLKFQNIKAEYFNQSKLEIHIIQSYLIIGLSLLKILIFQVKKTVSNTKYLIYR